MSEILKNNSSTRYVGILLIIATLIAGCSNSSSTNSQIPSNADVPAPETIVEPPQPENSDNISKENFDKIKDGMSLSEVEMIILGTKELVSTNQTDDKKTDTYKWETADATRSIEVTFENEKVVGKKEKGLK